MKESESVSVGEEGRAFMVIVLEDPCVWVWSERFMSEQHEGSAHCRDVGSMVISRVGRKAQRLGRRTCDQNVAGSSPCRRGGKILFSSVNVLC